VLVSLLQTAATPASSQTLATTVPVLLPSAVAFDPQGNLYVAEQANHTIRKVDNASNITTIAGTGIQGFSGDGGSATSAELDSPQGLAVDAASHLYISDTHNHRIRRVDLTTGIITTIAGSTPGFSGDNGPATSARLNHPTALAVDSDAALYVADTQNHRIRKISSAGIISTVAGTGTQGFSGDGGPATAATLDSPIGLAIDVSRNLYIADTHNHRIRRIDSTNGTITTISGTGILGFTGDASKASVATLALPHGITVDAAGNLYIADTANHRIRRIDATTGIISTLAGDGIQGFSGDAGPAAQAALNSPRSATLSQSNLLVLADTNNQRVRQLSSDSTIRTIAGLGTTVPGALKLTGSAVTAYGSGLLTATLATSAGAQGSITFLDTQASGTSAIGTATLSSNTAALDLSTLNAGVHIITGTYSGDQSHASAQSSALSISITPLQLTASVIPATLLYGQTIPPLTGTLTGVLPRDSANVSAAFTTTAALVSPAGSYPITATLSGPAAGNYTVGAIPPLAITSAPTRITLTMPPTSAAPGQTITLTAHVVSTTTGNPTGSVILLDGSTPQLTVPVSAVGDATIAISSLALGSHSLSVDYSGDTNFQPSASTAYPVAITTGASSADFALTSTGAASQSVVAGASATFPFSIQLQNTTGFSSPITLAASGLPNAATASFNPAYIPPGSVSNTFTLTISVPKASLQRPFFPSNDVIVAALLVPFVAFRRRKLRSRASLAIALLAVPSLTGCGDRIYTGSQSTSGATSYGIAVTATATTPSGSVLQHTANVTLVVQQN
jgi:sugar lactone lactonase YvrE